MLLSLIGLGLRRFKSGMPAASSCSLAISAACHPESDPDTPRLPWKWGVMGTSSDGEGGHCGFSSEEVEMPEEGKIYH